MNLTEYYYQADDTKYVITLRWDYHYEPMVYSGRMEDSYPECSELYMEVVSVAPETKPEHDYIWEELEQGSHLYGLLEEHCVEDYHSQDY